MNTFADSTPVRQLCAWDIDLCGSGRIKNNEIQHLCQVETSAGSEAISVEGERRMVGMEPGAHLSKLFL